jgi:KDO2-lipid IV(A) lauroyltransferase
MGTIGYYLALPVMYGVAWLPFPLLYFLSDIMYFLLFRVFGYRKQVVLSNLRNSFPEKSEADIRTIASRFYRWFCDLTLETLKTLTISPETVRQRVTFEGTEILRDFAQANQSVIIVLGHFGNWELAGARYSAEPGLPQLYVIYHPLQNKHFDGLDAPHADPSRNQAVHHAGDQQGHASRPAFEYGDGLHCRPDAITGAGLLDEFLGQDTPVFQGTEALVPQTGLSGGVYQHHPPKAWILPHGGGEHWWKIPAGQRVRGDNRDPYRRLERDIRNYPDLWLWTHRRWKHSRPSGVT